MKRIAIALAISTLTGCASVQDFVHDHPAVTAWSAVLVAGAIAASTSDHRTSPAGAISDPNKPPCAKQPDGSCR